MEGLLVKEAFIAVMEINDKIDDNFWNDKTLSEDTQKRMEENSYLYKLEFMSNGSEFCIEFMGLTIWESENDEREYDDDNDCYAESIKSYDHEELKQILKLDLELIKKYL